MLVVNNRTNQDYIRYMGYLHTQQLPGPACFT